MRRAAAIGIGRSTTCVLRIRPTPLWYSSAAAATTGGKSITELLKDLRHRTEAGVLDCKQALAACDNDMEKAVEWLRKKGAARADKKSDRETSYGILIAFPELVGGAAAVIKFCTETPFAAKSERFAELTENLRTQMSPTLAASIAELSSAPDAASQFDAVIAAGNGLPALAEKLNTVHKDDITHVATKMSEAVRVKNVWVLPGPAFVPNPKIPENVRQTPRSSVIGAYAHNAPAQCVMSGNLVSVVSLNRMTGGVAPTDADTVAFDALADQDAAVIGAAQDFAMFVVSQGGEGMDKMQHQSFLGGEETAGKFLSKRRLQLRSAMFLNFDIPTATIFPPLPSTTATAAPTK